MSAQTRLDLDGGGYIVGTVVEIGDEEHVLWDVCVYSEVHPLVTFDYAGAHVPNVVIRAVSTHV